MSRGKKKIFTSELNNSSSSVTVELSFVIQNKSPSLLTSIRIILWTVYWLGLPEVMLFVGRKVLGLRGLSFKVFFSFTKLTTDLKLGYTVTLFICPTYLYHIEWITVNDFIYSPYVLFNTACLYVACWTNNFIV